MKFKNDSTQCMPTKFIRPKHLSSGNKNIQKNPKMTVKFEPSSQGLINRAVW